MNLLNNDCLDIIIRLLPTNKCKLIRVNCYIRDVTREHLAARTIIRFIRYNIRDIYKDYQLGQSLLNNEYTCNPLCIIDITRNIHPNWTRSIVNRIMQNTIKHIGVTKETLMKRLEVKAKEIADTGSIYGQAKLGLELCWLYVVHNRIY